MANIGIKVNGEFLDLPADIKMRFRLRGPLFNRSFIPRSYTYPFKFDWTPRNMRILNYRHRLDAEKRKFQDTAELYITGKYFANGLIIVKDSDQDADAHLLIDLGALDEQLTNKTLKDIDFGADLNFGATPTDVINFANATVNAPLSTDKVMFAPLRNVDFYDNENPNFGVPRFHTGRLVSDGHVNPGIDGFVDGETFTIGFRILETDELKSVTFTARDDPQTATEFSSLADPELPSTPGYGGLPSPGVYLEWICRQLNESSAINDFFKFIPAPDYIVIFVTVDSIIIKAVQDSTKIKLETLTITASQWNPITLVNNSDYVNSVLNYYDSGTFIKDHATAFDVDRYYTLVPFPYLRHVYESIFSTFDFDFVNDFQTNAELKNLVLYQNYALDLIDGGYNIFRKSIPFKLIVPAVDVKDFLLAVNDMFCLVLLFDRVRNRFRIVPCKDLLLSEDFDDWSTVPDLSATPKKEFNLEDGIILDFQLDGGDGMTKLLVPNLDNYVLNPPVAEYGDLTGLEAVNSITLVQRTQQYYRWNGTKYNLIAANFYPYEVGEKTLEVTADVSPVHASKVRSDKDDFSWLVPEIRQKGSSDEFDLGVNDYDLRLMIYRGKWKNDAGGDYPLLNSHNTDYLDAITGAYSLLWHGDFGLFNVWWKDWFKVLENGERTVFYKALTFDQLYNLDFGRKKRIANQTYFIDEIEFIVANDRGIIQQRQYLIRT